MKRESHVMNTLRRPDDKICRVCGDKALGYNFSVITCESCKAFFRRNATKNKQLKCPFHNECKVDVLTRRFCQKCRLDKCLAVGMKKEWIMSEEEKQLKNAKINESRTKKKLENSANNWISSVDQSSNGSFPNLQHPKSPSWSCTNLISSQNHSDVHAKSSTTVNDFARCEGEVHVDSQQILPSVTSLMNKSCSVYPVQDYHFDSASGDDSTTSVPTDCSLSLSLCLENSNSGVNNGYKHPSKNWLPLEFNNEVVKLAVSAEYSSLACESGLQSIGSKTLNSIEIEKIQELLSANSIVKLRTEYDQMVYQRNKNPCLIDVINMTDNAIRKLIKMSKRINAFKNLCQEDQIALLKGSCTELMILRSVMTYDFEKDAWQVPELAYIKLDVLKEAKGNIYEEHKRFVQSFDPKWRTDEVMMLILSAIVLFSPTRPNIIHRMVVEKEQYCYYFLLQRYLESCSDTCNAKDQFLKLVQTVQDLQKLNENHVRVFLDVNPKDVEPLLIEIFDLSR